MHLRYKGEGRCRGSFWASRSGEHIMIKVGVIFGIVTENRLQIRGNKKQGGDKTFHSLCYPLNVI